jgi:hypothetical protein
MKHAKSSEMLQFRTNRPAAKVQSHVERQAKYPLCHEQGDFVAIRKPKKQLINRTSAKMTWDATAILWSTYKKRSQYKISSCYPTAASKKIRYVVQDVAEGVPEWYL